MLKAPSSHGNERRTTRLAAKRHDDLINQASDIILVLTSTGKLEFANPAFCKLLGYNAQELNGLSLSEVLDPACMDHFMQHFGRVLKGEKMPNVEAVFRTKDGSEVHVEGSCASSFAMGGPELVRGIFRDVTERDLRDTLASGQLRLLEMIATGVSMEQTLTELVLLIEQQCADSLGSILLLDADGAHLRHGAAPSLPPDYTRAVDGLAIGENVGSCGTAMFRREVVVVADIATDPLWADYRDLALRHGLRACWSTPINDSLGGVLGSFAIYHRQPGRPDARERGMIEIATHLAAICINRERTDAALRDSHEQLEFVSNFDALTGLARRALFCDRLDQFVLSAQQSGRHLAVLVLDLEHFKSVNDSHGTATGDALLKAVAERLIEFGGSAMYVARVGGDRFAAVVPGLKQAEDMTRLLQNRILKTISQPFRFAEQELRVSAKLGIALFPADGDDSESLFRNAEVALKKAKATGERYTFYKPQMSAAIKDRLSLDSELQQAFERKEFVLHYQPKICLQNNGICGAEALLRWNSPQRGLVPPNLFIPQLEESGMIVDVGRWVIEQAARDRRSWRAGGRAAPRVAVNVSQAQLRMASFADEAVAAALAGSGGAAPGVDLEVTESMLMTNIEANVEKLKRLRDLGMEISIDDFGTGYSSLNYLARLPINSVKIDRSFIVNMSGNDAQMNIVSAILSLARSMNLKTIAEGVDAEEQLKILRLLKCDEIQGWLYSKALPTDQFAALLQEGRKL